ncbi:hypothetical protein M0R45_008714 [Rubus argutus]|uniref:Uncharacterized protein n=1 Tax=Rubus argutus TaxID=59490 RepID=A0AAW1Y4X2_RUBAR
MKMDSNPFPAAIVNMVEVQNSLNPRQNDLSMAEGIMIGSIRLSPSKLTASKPPTAMVLCSRCHKELEGDEKLIPGQNANEQVKEKGKQPAQQVLQKTKPLPPTIGGKAEEQSKPETTSSI